MDDIARMADECMRDVDDDEDDENLEDDEDLLVGVCAHSSLLLHQGFCYMYFCEVMWVVIFHDLRKAGCVLINQDNFEDLNKCTSKQSSNNAVY